MPLPRWTRPEGPAPLCPPASCLPCLASTPRLPMRWNGAANNFTFTFCCRQSCAASSGRSELAWSPLLAWREEVGMGGGEGVHASTLPRARTPPLLRRGGVGEGGCVPCLSPCLGMHAPVRACPGGRAACWAASELIRPSPCCWPAPQTQAPPGTRWPPALLTNLRRWGRGVAWRPAPSTPACVCPCVRAALGILLPCIASS